MSFAGATENAVNTHTSQNTANTSVFESKTKNIVNYSIFAKNGGVYTVFAISRKRRRHETL